MLCCVACAGSPTDPRVNYAKPIRNWAAVYCIFATESPYQAKFLNQDDPAYQTGQSVSLARMSVFYRLCQGTDFVRGKKHTCSRCDGYMENNHAYGLKPRETLSQADSKPFTNGKDFIWLHLRLPRPFFSCYNSRNREQGDSSFAIFFKCTVTQMGSPHDVLCGEVECASWRIDMDIDETIQLGRIFITVLQGRSSGLMVTYSF